MSFNIFASKGVAYSFTVKLRSRTFTISFTPKFRSEINGSKMVNFSPIASFFVLGHQRIGHLWLMMYKW